MCNHRLSATERSRLFRYRKRNDIAAVTVNVELRKLIAAGLLSEKHTNKKSIAAIVENLMNKQFAASNFNVASRPQI